MDAPMPQIPSWDRERTHLAAGTDFYRFDEYAIGGCGDRTNIARTDGQPSLRPFSTFSDVITRCGESVSSADRIANALLTVTSVKSNILYQSISRLIKVFSHAQLLETRKDEQRSKRGALV